MKNIEEKKRDIGVIKTSGQKGETDYCDKPLPDYYTTVAQDMIDFCDVSAGKICMDIGSGAGGIGFAIISLIPDCVMILLDPNEEALARGLGSAGKSGVPGRIITVVGTAEKIPMPAESVDVVVSRGSFFFWNDRVQGLREVYRVLRSGGKAMIGGGLGSKYPQWARQEFIRRQRKSDKEKSTEDIQKFKELRSPETFRRLAVTAGLPSFEVIGEGGLKSDDPKTGIGIWLKFTKQGK
jgi:SAM-dependent methyltransferase